MSGVNLLEGDCLEVMETLAAGSVDAIVTDPPYGLGFMGKAWDGLPPGREVADALLRVLKPGGHVVAFGGTRTSHRLACALEDAGFEIRDSLMWIYGSGFPKSLDVSKAIDRGMGAEREVIGTRRERANSDASFVPMNASAGEVEAITAPATDAAREWAGWGTALKPAHEPIVLARKPLAGTVAGNVQAHGTGALNVDGCRVEGVPWTAHRATGLGSVKFFTEGETPEIDKQPHDAGRWPPNVLLTHSADCGDACAEGCPVAEMDRQSGDCPGMPLTTKRRGDKSGAMFNPGDDGADRSPGFGDSGGASRFFPRFRYTAKASSSERNAGLEGMQQERAGAYGEFAGDGRGRQTEHSPAENHHPTVKPIDLMRWLCRLVTPAGGTLLDPFMGSGTTGIAATREGFGFIGIEREPEYFHLAQRRIEEDAPLFQRGRTCPE